MTSHGSSQVKAGGNGCPLCAPLVCHKVSPLQQEPWFPWISEPNSPFPRELWSPSSFAKPDPQQDGARSGQSSCGVHSVARSWGGGAGPAHQEAPHRPTGVRLHWPTGRCAHLMSECALVKLQVSCVPRVHVPPTERSFKLPLNRPTHLGNGTTGAINPIRDPRAGSRGDTDGRALRERV